MLFADPLIPGLELREDFVSEAEERALIGRIGTSQPFGIGDQASVPMPFDGVLSLAVNDDERSDNAGAFMVSIGRGRR